MLDHDHRHLQLRADVDDEPSHVLGLLLVHARHGLVEQQQAGVHRQRPTELHALLHAVGQQADRQGAPGRQLEEVDDLLHAGAVRELLAARLADPRQGGERAVADVLVPPEHQVVEDGEVGEQLDVLEGPGHAEPRDRRWTHAHQLVAVQLHRALLGPVDAGEDVEDAGLARAVGADEREQLVGAYVEGDPVHGRDRPEGQPHVVDDQHRVHRLLLRLLHRLRGAHEAHRLRRR